MDNPLILLRDPWLVVLLALLIFIGRVVFLAKRLKAAARNPTLVDLRALDEAKKALDAHHESLDAAKRALSHDIEGARNALRSYKKPLARAVSGRRDGLAAEMKSLDHFDAPLEAARAAKRRTLKSAKDQAAFEDVKQRAKRTRPREGHRRQRSSKDM